MGAETTSRRVTTVAIVTGLAAGLAVAYELGALEPLVHAAWRNGWVAGILTLAVLSGAVAVGVWLSVRVFYWLAPLLPMREDL